MTPLSPHALACLDRTRSAVLNVLMAAGLGIAISGWLLRWHERRALFPGAHPQLRQGLIVGLFGVAVASYVVRRVMTRRGALHDPKQRAARFYRGHVLAAVLAALAVPLGLVYGWIDRPRLDTVGPFWVVTIALGLLALPRAYEMEGFDSDVADSVPGTSESNS
jgi:hypothetical protein